MSFYKLTYFPVKALGEPIRFLLKYGDIEFEDYRLDRDNWSEIKTNMPFGQVPVLEVDGKTAFQSIAICRYLAKKVKLVGRDDWEDLEIDSIVDTINDLRQKISSYFKENDCNLKEKQKQQLYGDILPFYLERLDSIARMNDGHLATKRVCLKFKFRALLQWDFSRSSLPTISNIVKLTWADLYFVALLDYIDFAVDTEIIRSYPNLQDVKKNVMAIPNIRRWVEERPKSDF